MPEVIQIVLDTKAQTQGVKDVISHIQTLKGGVESLAKSLIGIPALIAGIGSAITGGLLGKGIQSAISNAAEIGKAAQRAGEDVSEFSALVGGKAGEVADSMAKASRFLVQWMEKTGQSGRNITEVFLEQADVISKTVDQDEKLRLAQERFGRSAQELIPLLNKGSSAIREKMETARALGLVIGPEFAEHAEKFQQNLKKISSFLTGLFNAAAEELLPVLLKGTNAIVAWMKESSASIRSWIKEGIDVILSAWQQSKLMDLISLSIQSGLEEGSRLGSEGAASIARTVYEKLFTVDFLIFAAKAGRILANALLEAVRLPVDALTAGFEFLLTNQYNLWIATFDGIFTVINKMVKSVMDTITDGLNSFKFLGKFQPIKLQIPIEPLQPPPDFLKLFDEQHKRSGEAVQNLTHFFDDQIKATEEILKLGEQSEHQDTTKLSSYQKLLDLLHDLKKASVESLPKLPDQPQLGPNPPTKGGLENQQKDIEGEIAKQSLLVEQLKTRDLILESSGRTVGSLQQESDEIKKTLESMIELANQRRALTKEMVEFGLISKPEARDEEIKDARELLALQRELIALKNQTNDFTFFQKLSKNIQDIGDQFKHVGASIADVLGNGIRSAINTVSTGLWQVIDGTATWGNLFIQVGRQIISSLIQIAIQELIVDQIKRGITVAWAAFKSAFIAKDVAETNAGEAAKTPALAANATLASIGSWGLAVAIGVAAIAAILATVGAFESGGVVRGGEQVIRVNESGTESVLNARATAALGHDRINRFNMGQFDLEQRIAGNMALPPGTNPMNQMGSDSMSTMGMHAPSQQQSGQETVSIILVDSRNSQAAKDFIESSGGRVAIIDIVKNNKTEIGIR